MNVITNATAAQSSFVPQFIKPYLNAIENIGVIAENITKVGVSATELLLATVELQANNMQVELASRPRLA